MRLIATLRCVGMWIAELRGWRFFTRQDALAADDKRAGDRRTIRPRMRPRLGGCQGEDATAGAITHTGARRHTDEFEHFVAGPGGETDDAIVHAGHGARSVCRGRGSESESKSERERRAGGPSNPCVSEVNGMAAE